MSPAWTQRSKPDTLPLSWKNAKSELWLRLRAIWMPSPSWYAFMEAEDHPNDLRATEKASEGIQGSLSHFDALNSDSVWFLLAFSAQRPVGLAALTRIPKLDACLGFLYLDELHVIREVRLQGVGKALLERGIELTHELGLAGIRLLARVDNDPACHLYESLGFIGDETMLYQFRFDPSDSQA